MLETKDWITLIIGGLIGFIPALVAGFLIDPILKFLEARKLISRSKRFQKAAKFHKLVTDLRSGRIDKYLYMLRLLVPIIVGILSAFIFGIVGLFLTLASKLIQGDADVKIAITINLFVSGVISGGMAYIYVRASSHYRSIMWALNGFEEFDAEFKQRWADHLK
jgi:uncharacterized membrane protein YfcA